MKSFQPKNLHLICFMHIFLLIVVSKATSSTKTPSDNDDKTYYLSIWDPLSPTPTPTSTPTPTPAPTPTPTKPKPKEKSPKPTTIPPDDEIITATKPQKDSTSTPTPTSTPTSTSTTSTSPSPTTPPSENIDNNPATSSDMIDSDNNKRNGSSIGLIIGITIAIIIIGICAFAGFLWRRRRLRRFSRVTPMESWKILNDPSTDFRRSSRMPMTTNYSPSQPSKTFRSNQEFPKAKRLVYDRETTLPKIRRSNDAWEQYLSMVIQRPEQLANNDNYNSNYNSGYSNYNSGYNSDYNTGYSNYNSGYSSDYNTGYSINNGYIYK